MKGVSLHTHYKTNNSQSLSGFVWQVSIVERGVNYWWEDEQILESRYECRLVQTVWVIHLLSHMVTGTIPSHSGYCGWHGSIGCRRHLSEMLWSYIVRHANQQGSTAYHHWGEEQFKLRLLATALLWMWNLQRVGAQFPSTSNIL